MSILEIKECNRELILKITNDLQKYYPGSKKEDFIAINKIFDVKNLKYKNINLFPFPINTKGYIECYNNYDLYKVGDIYFGTVYLLPIPLSNIAGVTIYILPKFKYKELYRKLRYKKNNDKIIIEDNVKVFYDDVNEYLKNQELFQKNNISVNRGYLLHGKPGNSKTSVLKKLNIKTSKITTQTIIHSINNNTNIFDSIYPIIMDDIDIELLNRNGKYSDIACTLLSQMDGLSGRNAKLFFITTNEDVKDIEPAFLRPGRIDRIFHFDNPGHDSREKYYLEVTSPLFKERINKDEFVSSTEKLSYAELKFVHDNVLSNILTGKNYDVKEVVDILLDKKDIQKKMGFKVK